MRASDDPHSVQSCTPSIIDIDIPKPPEGISSFSGHCAMGFPLKSLQDINESNNGSCWVGLFGNPVLVYGYPTLKRAPELQGKGLDIPINLVAQLMGTRCFWRLGNVTMLKEYSSLLVATEVLPTAILWHLEFKKDRSKIGLNSISQNLIDNPTLFFPPSYLWNAQTIIGWSKNVTDNTGTIILISFIFDDHFVELETWHSRASY